MKKNLFIRIILILGVILIVLMGIRLFIGKDVNSQEEYKDYVCKDPHLECVDYGKKLGNQVVEVYGSKLFFTYRKINGVSENDFVYASMAWFVPSGPVYYVLQNPESQVDVLREWEIEKIQLYNEDLNTNVSISDKEIIEDFSKQLIEKKDVAEYPDISSGELEYISGRVEINFKEVTALKWVSQYRIYKSESSQALVILSLGSINQNWEYSANPYLILDPSCELYKRIMELHQDSVK